VVYGMFVEYLYKERGRALLSPLREDFARSHYRGNAEIRVVLKYGF